VALNAALLGLVWDVSFAMPSFHEEGEKDTSFESKEGRTFAQRGF